MRNPHHQQHTNTQPGRTHRTNRHSTAGAPGGPRIAVVGGSLTGPVVALLLTQAGFAYVTLYEAMPASTTLGGGLISLEHSSLGILDHLGIGQDEYVHIPSETIWQTPVHRRMLGEPTRRAYPGRFTTWTQLNQALTGRLPDGMAQTGARVTGLTAHGQCALLHFADGRTEPADLVVFADGRASTGRSLLDPDRQLHYAGYVGHRGAVACNPTGMVDFWRLEPGPGVQFNIAPIPGGVDWTFYLNATPAEYAEWFGVAPHRRLFAQHRHVSDIARAHVDGNAVWHLPEPYASAVHCTTTRTAFPVMDIDPPTRMVWPIGDGFAVLLGDALAPVRAHTARGANNGLEQADGLVTALCQHHRHGADLGTALTGWQRRHLPAAVSAARLGPVIGARLGLGTTAAALPAARGAVEREPALAGAR
ncbi:Rossmann-fold NAD(P)-binding domain-containing protein [Dactylosporangium darangshiense]